MKLTRVMIAMAVLFSATFANAANNSALMPPAKSKLMRLIDDLDAATKADGVVVLKKGAKPTMIFKEVLKNCTNDDINFIMKNNNSKVIKGYCYIALLLANDPKAEDTFMYQGAGVDFKMSDKTTSCPTKKDYVAALKGQKATLRGILIDKGAAYINPAYKAAGPKPAVKKKPAAKKPVKKK